MQRIKQWDVPWMSTNLSKKIVKQNQTYIMPWSSKINTRHLLLQSTNMFLWENLIPYSMLSLPNLEVADYMYIL